MFAREPGEKPFFTIGVPTYDRHDMLRETLDSVLAQTFTDFEIIIGNDYTAEILTGEMIGITDPRVRIVNHPVNLREVGNMNALLEMATGRYFTWLYDDDLYEPDFLQISHDYLVKTGFPPVLFPSFRMMKLSEQFQPRKLQVNAMIEFTGREYLNWYSAEKPQIASTFGLFDTTALRSKIGKVEELSTAIVGHYSEHLLIVQCALLGRIVFIDAPLYVFRRHVTSNSESTQDVERYQSAGRELLLRCATVLRHPDWSEDLSINLLKIAKIHIITFAYVASRFEFAQNNHLIGTIYHTLSRHWDEFRNTRKLYIDQGGDAGLLSSFSFFRTLLHCQYLILRLLIHFQTMNRG